MLIPHCRVHTFNPGLTVFTAGRGAGDWWDPDGSIGCCVAAYQAKGAASYAASKINLANPGTFDATEGVAPAWAAGTGWTFNGINQYLKTGVKPNETYSIILRVSGIAVAINPMYGVVQAGNNFRMYPNHAGGRRHYQNVGAVSFVGTVASGVLCIAGKQPYLNGVAEAAPIAAGAFNFTFDIALGAMNVAGVYVGFTGVTMQAVAIYSCTLTAPQVFSVYTRMAAL